MAMYESRSKRVDDWPDMSSASPMVAFNNRATLSKSGILMIGNKMYLEAAGVINFSTSGSVLADWTICGNGDVYGDYRDCTGKTIDIIKNSYVKQKTNDAEDFGIDLDYQRDIHFIVKGTMNVNTPFEFRAVIDFS